MSQLLLMLRISNGIGGNMCDHPIVIRFAREVS